MFSSFTKNGHTAWFDPQMKKLEPYCIVKQTVPQYCIFPKNDFTAWIYSQVGQQFGSCSTDKQTMWIKPCVTIRGKAFEKYCDCFAIQCGSNFFTCGSNHAVWPFVRKPLNSWKLRQLISVLMLCFTMECYWEFFICWYSIFILFHIFTVLLFLSEGSV